MPLDDVVIWLETEYPALEYEIERNWVWILTDLAPVHRKCECVECKERADIRKSIKDFGFIYKDGDHECPSGSVARWSHHCEHPIKFQRRGKAQSDEAETGVAKPNADDALLLAALEE